MSHIFYVSFTSYTSSSANLFSSPKYLYFINIVIGTLAARQPDIDINRVKLLPKERFRHISSSNNLHSRRSIVDFNRFSRNNAYDFNSSRFTKLRTPVQFQYDATTSSATQATIKVHQSRENPQLFYQSDSYLKEAFGKNVNHDVSSIYPGREVIRAGEETGRPARFRIKYRESNDITEDFDLCVKCPHDRTLIAKAGADRVLIQNPRLVACSGREAPRDTSFIHMYGPKFGSLLKQGSHMIIGQISHKNQILQTCKMQIHVLIQSCPVPKYLSVHCEDQNKTCIFSCRDPKMNLKGQSTLSCGEDMKWMGNIPVCRVRTWCEPPPPPKHGRISCKGLTVDKGRGLAEGSVCRVKCARGWHWNPRAIAGCRRGAWSHELTCQPKRRL